MTLVVILGPLAVGKMTVGQKLCEATGFKLLHNHMTLDAVTPIFEFGSDPCATLVSEFRWRIVEEAAKSDLPGLVYTFVWAFDGPDDTDLMRRSKAMVESHGGRVCFVELKSSMETRKERALTENRKKHKPRNLEHAPYMEQFEEGLKLNSSGDFPFPESHLLIDNEKLSPEDAAAMIRKHFGI